MIIFMSYPKGESVGGQSVEVAVEMSEWKKGAPNSILTTTGLGPCTGIAIYNPEKRIGHMGHFIAPHIDRRDVESMFESALSETNDPAKLPVWMRGCCDEDDYYGLWPDDGPSAKEYKQLSRDYLAELLASHGMTNIDTDWNLDSESSVWMDLDCQTGAFESGSVSDDY